eukprot:NODE_4240_length_694_cov_232.577465.p5 GENE.NODE_4240_length_694_cov_232.577465~~NODE_4240_length_694_cov_232.577465.p5  ORF type:complete len:57 (+),score=34.60 NODE_4240_length_694_cov_232.577465:465-635(+)
MQQSPQSVECPPPQACRGGSTAFVHVGFSPRFVLDGAERKKKKKKKKKNPRLFFFF